MQITQAPPAQSNRPTQAEWNKLMAPDPGEGDAVVLGRRAQEPLPASMAEVRQQVARLDYNSLDPFVASVAASVASDQVEVPKGETTVSVAVPGYYKQNVNALLGTQNGPNVPILLILPGIHAGGERSHNSLLKKLALERGMNYVVLPNSMNEGMLAGQPNFHPGNPRVDALATREVVQTLKASHPEYFSSISVAGYSYGALQGANLIRLDEEGSDRLIDGGLVAFSPPENLQHSMLQLDGLRNFYEGNKGLIADTGLRYKHEVKKLGYEGFMGSSLSHHGPGSDIDEVEIADTYGSRNGLKSMVEEVDKQFDHLLPMNTSEYQHANPIKKLKMRDEQKHIVEDMTYKQFSDDWMSQDQWLQQQGLNPTQMAEKYSFSNAMQAIEHTPVMVLGSADDYILGPGDLNTLRALEAHPGALEVTRIVDHGGHVGLDWNPAVAETAIDFAMAAPHLKS